MTLSIADRFSKAQKIRVLPAVGKDPESQRLERIKVHNIHSGHLLLDSQVGFIHSYACMCTIQGLFQDFAQEGANA